MTKTLTLKYDGYTMQTVTLADLRAQNVALWGEAKVAANEREVRERFAATRARERAARKAGA